MAFNGRFVLNFAYFAAQQGGDYRGILASTGKSEKALLKPETTIDSPEYNQALEVAIQTSNDKFLGLHAGEQMNLAAAGLILQLVQTSETVKEALHHCCHFANLGCSSLPMSLVEKDKAYHIQLTPNPLWRKQSEVAFQQTAAGVLAFTIKEFQSLTHRKHRPIAVHLSWKEEDIKEYERVFGCPVFSGKQELAILLNKEHVEDKVVSADYELQRILLLHAETISAKLAKKAGVGSIVAQTIVKLQSPGFPSLDEVARHLNTSARSLQRRLQSEGKSFLEIRDEVKNQIAQSYLQKPDLSISEIAYMLDYSDITAFSRSFKKWNGVSPNGFRMK